MKSFRERNIKRLLYCQCFQIQLQRREVPNLCNKGTITFAKRLFYFLWTNTQLKSYSDFFTSNSISHDSENINLTQMKREQTHVDFVPSKLESLMIDTVFQYCKQHGSKSLLKIAEKRQQECVFYFKIPPSCAPLKNKPDSAFYEKCIELWV